MRQDITDTDEEAAWQRLMELVTDSDYKAVVHDAIKSADKENITELWWQKCMMMIPIVDRHHMIPFHDRWVQRQFKEEQNTKQMTERLSARVDNQPP